jgi:iron-sulfur cluster assembly protein
VRHRVTLATESLLWKADMVIHSHFPFMIQLTDSAVCQLRRLLEEKGASAGSGLRLAVERGGCAGLQYSMRVAEPAEGDRVFPHEDVSVIVAADSLDLLDGCRIDYVDALHDAGFKIENPHAARSCGCGTSFEPKHVG